jgi:hypothetical protein
MMAHTRIETGRGDTLTGRKWWDTVQIALYVAAGALLAVSLLLLADRWRWAVTCPYDIQYGEGGVLLSAINIARGNEVYNDFRHYPFAVETYPPVYQALCAVGVKLCGVSFAFGRVLTCLSTLGIAGLIWAMLRRAGISRFAAALAPVLFLAAPPIASWWGCVMRVDMTAVFLGLAGMYCAMRGGRWLIAAVALMGLAVYTRQSVVAPMAASIVHLWWMRERRNAVLLLTSWAGLVMVAFAALQIASHGWFYRHVVVSNQNVWQLGLLARLWKGVFLDCPGIYVLGLLGAGFALSSVASRRPPLPRQGSDQPLRLFLLYFVFAYLASLAAGKVGAYINYLVEPLAASCLMAAIVYHRLPQTLGSWQGRAAWAAAWLALVLSFLLPAARATAGGKYRAELAFRRSTVRGAEAAIDLIRRTEGDVLSEDTGLLLLTGRQVLLEPFEFTQMFRDGTWNQRPLLQDIARRRFALIVLRWNEQDRWSVGMKRAIMRNYYVMKTVGGLDLMAPADAAHPSRDAAERRLAPTPGGA